MFSRHKKQFLKNTDVELAYINFKLISTQEEEHTIIFVVSLILQEK